MKSKYSLVALLLTSTLCGCARNPNIEIVGSYFPGWMVSLALAVLLTSLAHVVLRRLRMLHSIGHPAIIYPAMTLLFTCLLWLCIFA